MNLIPLFFIFLSFFPFCTFALVDYSGQPQGRTSNAPMRMPPAPQVIERPASDLPAPPTSRSPNARQLEFSNTYHSLKMNNTNRPNAQVNLLENNLRWSPPLDLFFELNYFSAQTSSKSLSDNSNIQTGNVKGLLGLHWMKWGAPNNSMSLDLFTSYSHPNPNSDFATSRRDITCGIETSKEFQQIIVLGLGSDYTFESTPTNSKEMGIGSIWRIGGGLGALLSSQIRLSLEAYSYKISEGQDLSESIQYSVLSPKLYLIPSQYFELNLGMHVPLTHPNQEVDLTSAKLFNLPGIYGPSVFSGLALIF